MSVNTKTFPLILKIEVTTFSSVYFLNSIKPVLFSWSSSIFNWLNWAVRNLPLLLLSAGGVPGAAAERSFLPDSGGFSGAAGERVAIVRPQVQPAEQPESQQPGQRLHAHLPAVSGLCAPGEVLHRHRCFVQSSVQSTSLPSHYVTSLHFPSMAEHF